MIDMKKVNDNKKIDELTIFNYSSLKTFLIFIFVFLLNYIMKFKLEINIDLFLPFIIYISISYGLKSSIFAIALSILSFVFYSISYYNGTILLFIQDRNMVLYITIYFAVGVGLGYFIEERKKQDADNQEEIKQLKEDDLCNKIDDFINSYVELSNAMYEVDYDFAEDYPLDKSFHDIDFIDWAEATKRNLSKVDKGVELGKDSRETKKESTIAKLNKLKDKLAKDSIGKAQEKAESKKNDREM